MAIPVCDYEMKNNYFLSIIYLQIIDNTCVYIYIYTDIDAIYTSSNMWFSMSTHY